LKTNNHSQTFDVNAEAEPPAAVGEQALIVGQVGAALHVAGEFHVEEVQHLPRSCELVMPAKINI